MGRMDVGGPHKMVLLKRTDIHLALNTISVDVLGL